MHPLFFPKLLMFMKMKCLSCHDFRLGKRQTRIFCAKLHLIDVGRVNEALELDGLLASASMNAGAGQFAKSTTSGRTSSSSSTRQAQNDAVSAGGNAIDDILNDKLSVGPPSSSTSSNNGSLTTHERSARRHILKQFQSACTKCIKCANCQAFSPKVRHDQFNKMFQIPLGSKGKKSNIGNRVRIRSACSIVGSGLYTGDDDGEEEDVWPDSEDEAMDDVDEVESSEEEEEEDDNNNNGSLIDDEAIESSTKKKKKKKKSITEDEEENDATVSTSKLDKDVKQDNFMNNLEIEAQCRLTWEKQPLICSKFFGSAHTPDAGEGGVLSNDTFDSFAYVTDDEQVGSGNNNNARRNRPRSTSNAEQVQGGGKGYSIFFLRAVPVPPSRFRPPVIMGQMTIEHSQNYYLSKVLELNAQLRTLFNVTHELMREEGELKSTLANSSDGTDTARQLKKVRDEKDKTQANLLRIWVELQTTVNCFMDSSRDPRASGTGSAPNGIRQLLEKKEGVSSMELSLLFLVHLDVHKLTLIASLTDIPQAHDGEAC